MHSGEKTKEIKERASRKRFLAEENNKICTWKRNRAIVRCDRGMSKIDGSYVWTVVEKTVLACGRERLFRRIGDRLTPSSKPGEANLLFSLSDVAVHSSSQVGTVQGGLVVTWCYSESV